MGRRGVPLPYRLTHGRCSGLARWLEWIFCLAAGFGLALFCMRSLRASYFPAFQAIASAQVSNEMTEQINQLITDYAAEHITYSDVITLQRDESGNITAITTDSVKINKLRSDITLQVANLVSGLNPSDFSVPVGSLTGFTLLSGRGFSIPVTALTAGTVEATFHQEFAQAGINQTRHRLTLEITVPVQLYLSGQIWTTTVDTELLLAETVLVGQVPDLYLQSGQTQDTTS